MLSYGDVLTQALSKVPAQGNSIERLALVLGRFLDLLMTRVLKQEPTLARDDARQLCARLESKSDPSKITITQDRSTSKFYIQRFQLENDLYLSTSTLKYLITNDKSENNQDLKHALWNFVFDNPHREGDTSVEACLQEEAPAYKPNSYEWQETALGQASADTVILQLQNNHYSKTDFGDPVKIALLGNQNYFIDRILDNVRPNLKNNELVDLANALNNLKRFHLTWSLSDRGV